MAETSKPNYGYVWAATGEKAVLAPSVISQGWVVGKPSYQRANAVENRQDQMLQHIDQHGIAVWGAETEYFANKSWVTGSNGELYRAVTDSVGVNPVGDTSNKWYRVLDEFFTKTQSDARYLALAVPSGAVFHFAMETAPAGYLVCNGGAVSRTAFSPLFSAIGTRYGSGDGSTTFNLPDLRGEFIRGADLGRGVDVARLFGSWQPDELRSHGHEGVPLNIHDVDRGVGGSSLFSLDNVGTTAPTGGVETRPRNIALLSCIKV